MAEATDKTTAPETSGAPDRQAEAVIATEEHTTPTPVWDARNRLVDAELVEHFKRESDIVLGKVAPVGEAEIAEQGEVGEGGEKLLRDEQSAKAPYVSQQLDSQTSDPTTAPLPSYDPNSRPSTITSSATATKAHDKLVIETAKEIERIDNSISDENPQPPVQATDAGNVLGNPLGAQGGNKNGGEEIEAAKLPVTTEETAKTEATAEPISTEENAAKMVIKSAKARA